ncbi:MAG: hypothetical protein IAX21_11455 [Candidatus Bathyarchaeota archaeon]|nr:hypothetical protein [Candidatus Bathyarchaeum tardum]WNZ29223.1 MAG: hypothetical protein IAX21_11455 [Candidatus Bathyarchaeota archaeon]
MLTFELSAIDLILAIAVVVLLIMYITKLEPKNPEQKSFFKQINQIRKSRQAKNPKVTPKIQVQNDYAECPRGFGNIRKIGEDNSVSERCLGCYRIMECYEQKQ